MVDFHSKLKTKEMNPRDCTDVSIDCESLGTAYNAPVLSIGAVQFNRYTGQFGKTFYVEIRMASAIKGAESGISPDTIYWWMKQSPTIAAKLFDDSDVARARKLGMADALLQLADFVRTSGSPCIWSRGVMQDISWLENAYAKQAIGLSQPWLYQKVRDVRTILALAEDAGFDETKVVFEGTPHDALADAVHQAHLICMCTRLLTPGAIKKPPAITPPTPPIIVPAPAPFIDDDEI